MINILVAWQEKNQDPIGYQIPNVDMMKLRIQGKGVDTWVEVDSDGKVRVTKLGATTRSGRKS